jgi:hypothetical protein
MKSYEKLMFSFCQQKNVLGHMLLAVFYNPSGVAPGSEPLKHP